MLVALLVSIAGKLVIAPQMYQASSKSATEPVSAVAPSVAVITRCAQPAKDSYMVDQVLPPHWTSCDSFRQSPPSAKQMLGNPPTAFSVILI